MRYNHTGETDVAYYNDLESGECVAEVVYPMIYHSIGEDVIIGDIVYKICHIISDIKHICITYQLKEV